MAVSGSSTVTADGAAVIRLSNLWWAAAALAVMVAAILGSSLWFLNFVHVLAGLLWTGIFLTAGAIFLALRTRGGIEERAHAVAERIAWPTAGRMACPK